MGVTNLTTLPAENVVILCRSAYKCYEVRQLRKVRSDDKLLSSLGFLRFMACRISPLLTARS